MSWSPPGLARVPEARHLPLLPCHGARDFRKPGLLPSRLGLLEPFLACNFYSVHSNAMLRPGLGAPKH